ncbi:MAG: N-acetylmuramoyl-L-alanine amidase [Clostridia bacterium]|nr:N-acetylmuramoyl-L-alanine amidase [Clostridia bacterium]
MKIIIDAGHGGTETGAVAFGMKEKDLNLIFADLLAKKLQGLGIEVDRSLINDNQYDSTRLTDIIKKSGAALCISCHNNSFNGSARGFEVIHSIHSNGNLARYIADEVKKTGFPVRRTFSRRSTNPQTPDSDYYFIIRLTYPQVETIIVEFGFLDNSEDFKILTNPTWRDRLTNAVALGVKKYIPSDKKPKTPIMGNSILKPNQLKAALKDINPKANTSIVDLYYDIARDYGVKADIAFFQAMHETNWLKFTGVVKPEQNNFAGLGATGGTNSGESFPSVEVGVEAHIQHLYAYASTSPLPQGTVLYDTRFNLVQRGSARNWEDLNGKWAVPGVGYGESIVALQEMVSGKYPDTGEPPVHWAKACNDELLNSGFLNSDHTDTLDDYATEGMVICMINKLRKELMKDG